MVRGIPPGVVREGSSEKQKQEMSHMQGCGTAGQGNSKEAPSSPGLKSPLFIKTLARGGSPVSPEEQSHFEADARLSRGRAGPPVAVNLKHHTWPWP